MSVLKKERSVICPPCEIKETEQSLRQLESQASTTNATLARIEEVGGKFEAVGQNITRAGKTLTTAVTTVANFWKHRDEIIEKKREYHLEHKDDIDAYNRDYYQTYSDEIKMRARK